jgi:nucleoid DNA-binding protein
MARLVQAVAVYGPRAVLTPTARLDELAEWLAPRSGLNKSDVVRVLLELNEAIIFFNRRGTAVQLSGIGRFGPTVRGDGRIRVTYRPDPQLRNGLNANGGYRGEIRNRSRIGLGPAGYKELWDADHPEDPLELPGG